MNFSNSSRLSKDNHSDVAFEPPLEVPRAFHLAGLCSKGMVMIISIINLVQGPHPKDRRVHVFH